MKQIQKLYPITEGEQPIEREFEVVEDLVGYVEKLKSAGVKVETAKKDCVVRAREVQVGETIDTRPRTIVDGKPYTFSETVRTVDESKAGFIAVTNPDGEEYMMSPEKFASKYSANPDGTYQSVGGPQDFIRVSEDIIITPSNWGGATQTITAGGLLNVSDMGDVYGITNAAFDATYKPVAPVEANVQG